MIVESALQEDVDVVGLSILSGAHMALLPLIAKKLQEADLGHVLVVAGGIIPDEDVTPLREAGIHGIFTPGASTQEIIDFIRANVSPEESLTLD
jgi:methylmalonyl-CoA mutase C-terminal domain/subunit